MHKVRTSVKTEAGNLVWVVSRLYLYFLY